MTSPGCRIGDFMWNHLPQGRCTPILIIDFAQNQAPLHKVQPKALHCRSLIVQISTTPHSHVPLKIDEIIGILTPANNCSRKSCSRPSLHSGQPKKLLFMVLKRYIERIVKKCQKQRTYVIYQSPSKSCFFLCPRPDAFLLVESLPLRSK